MGISATSYEKLRDSIWAKRSQNSLENPTQAMLDIMEKMENPPIKTPNKGRKRTKSFCDEKTNNTPAMMEVMKLKKMKSMDDANSNLAEAAALLPIPFLKLTPVVPTSVIDPKKKPKKSQNSLTRSPSAPEKTKVSRKTELKRLSSFLDEPVQRRRTRSDADTANRELRSNLRTAFNFGIGMIRQVSI